MSRWDVVGGPHLLFTGRNGRRVAGITVTNPEYDPASGRRQTWGINLCALEKDRAWLHLQLGMEPDDFEEMLTELREIARPVAHSEEGEVR